jgi:hypothetical protein
LQIVLQLGEAFFELGALFLRHRPHFGIGLGIGNQRFGAFEFTLCIAIPVDHFDHRRELGMFFRQFHEGRTGRAGRKLRFHRLKPVAQSFEFVGGDHGRVSSE